MPNEREDFYQPLTVRDFDIDGNVFRAYYDADDKMVFVVDTVVSDVKPNVLLVINPVGNRKWDDILMNDYGVDLETVRPKKDNKYQKLDIEYVGLSDYDRLVRLYQAGGDLTDALAQLNVFRNMAARRAAIERLQAADLTATRARETIDKTADTIDEMQTRLKTLRGKLNAQRRDVGREPTKQSAAKILRTESQIDATNDKLARAKKRIVSAQNRVAAAEDEADVARGILARLNQIMAKDLITEQDDDDDVLVPMVNLSNTDVVPVVDAPLPAVPDDENTELTVIPKNNLQQKADDMADEDVKPLFDTDPKILDEEIAFKPVEFDAPTEPVVVPDFVPEFVKEPVQETVPESEPVVQPISFIPPAIEEEVVVPAEPEYVQPTAPVLDSLTSVDVSRPEIDSELLGGADDVYAPGVDVVRPAPVADAPEVPRSMPEIAVAPNSSDFRPVSPISGDDDVVSVDADAKRRKPTLLYYVLLIGLIVLSIFALWMFQKKYPGDTMPNFGATVAPVEETVVEEVVQKPEVVQPVVVESPVVEPVTPVVPAEPAVVPDVVPEPVPVTPAVPVTVAVEFEPEVVPVTPVVEEPVKKVPTEEEVLASKPAYNVSQNEKMFVAGPEYETDDVVAEPVVDVVGAVDVTEPVVKSVAAPVVTVGTPAVVNKPVPQMVVSEPVMAEPEFVPEYAEYDAVVQETVDVCADGNAPDADGCCNGETLTNVGGGVYVCCDEVTGDCFDPMF